MTISKDKFFECVLVFLPPKGRTPGMKLMALFHVEELDRTIIINNDQELGFETICSNGKSKLMKNGGST